MRNLSTKEILSKLFSILGIDIYKLFINTPYLLWQSGGPYWKVLKGRKDGRVSKASDTANLPAPTLNVGQLIQSFAKRGLGVKDMVTLSGGHTLGFSHCSSFEARLHNFSSVHDTDPRLNTEFALDLKNKCPKPNNNQNAGQFLDSTASVFDNDYYKQLLAGKGVFSSDQSLVGDYRTRWIVEAFARDQSLFFKEFAASMLKLGNLRGSDNGEVRLNCRVVNWETLETNLPWVFFVFAPLQLYTILS